MTQQHRDRILDIGILGTGAMACGLGKCWAAAGHRITIGGRSPDRAAVAASNLGGAASGTTLAQAATGRDVVLLAVPWNSVADTLHAAGATAGSLAGATLIDCTNPVEHGTGVLPPDLHGSAAQQIASWARGAHVIKAFNIFPASVWSTARVQGAKLPVVALAGDDADSIGLASTLVRDAHGVPALIGDLSRARQIEEAAGLVIALAFSGFNPASAVPGLPG